MTKEVREVVRIAIVGLALMMVIPFSYRVWRWYNPQAESKPFSLSGFLEKSSSDRAVALLKLPISKWTDYDKKSEPKIYAWLRAHEKVVLPWEWTEEARKKDPEGYRKLWLKLFKEQESELKSKLKSEQKKLKALEREIWIAETLYTHRTNQLARVKAYVATNTFPMTITVERLSKGRFWGWNAKLESKHLENIEEWGGECSGWNTLEDRHIEKEFQSFDSLWRDVYSLRKCSRFLEAKVDLSHICKDDLDGEAFNGRYCLSRICTLIR